MISPPPVAADWLPLREPELCTAGVWWDAIRVSEDLGRMALGLLRERGQRSAPAILDPRSLEPRMYLLVPVNASRDWHEPGTVALGDGSHVVVPPYEHTEGPGLHWFAQPKSARIFLNTAQLRDALTYLISAEADGAEL
ncbi:hypothetical protein ACFQVC_17825 [Streptomyces monticola]|uniref:Uncharacterized protein n=1 Tax=Streptomyces monticola TaxID=2666263 RepID=A0ABW2JL57_9ACTN